MAEVGAARATVIAYVKPVVSVLLGVGFLAEPAWRSACRWIAGSVMATRRS